MSFLKMLVLLTIPTLSWASNKMILNKVHFPDESIPTLLIQETYSHLSTQALALKIKASLERPLMFIRSFVNTYYADLSAHNSSNNLIVCFGDPHPENFGFMKFGSTTRYLYNDLDDTGVCPLEYDILRYFTSLSLFTNESALLKDLVKEYASVLHGKKNPEQLHSDLYDDLNEKKAKILRKYTNGQHFIPSDEYLSISASDSKIIIDALAENQVTRNLQILDTVGVYREAGGSGGLARFWVLARTHEGLDILELKQMARPGTSYGKWQQGQINHTQRMEEVKKHLWGTSPAQYHIVKIQRADFLIRSRSKGSVNLEKLKKDKRAHVLAVQVGILAKHHQKYLNREIDQLEEWILDNVSTLNTRYQQTYQRLLRQY